MAKSVAPQKTTRTASSALRKLPSVDEVLRSPAMVATLDQFGRQAVVGAVRGVLAEARKDGEVTGDIAHVASVVLARLGTDAQPSLRTVFNLTGTVLHTNLGRALLAEQAVEAAVAAMRSAVALEFDVDGAHRGERDDHVRGLLRELTGAEDATIVNNNAASVLLVLNTLARGREAIVSRGELIEIGGAFRMPDIMARAGTRLIEIGTTNRTHPKDYIGAIGEKTGLILKVHTSNYRIEGFTKQVPAQELAILARERQVPLVNDLGSGTLVDLRRFGLAHEPTVAEAVAKGADLVTFSGDKLLGGPQAGFIVGRKDLIAKLNRNPMKRSLRVDKIRLAAVEATLKLYRDPDRLSERLPTFRMLARPKQEIEGLAQRLAPVIARVIGASFTVSVTACHSQVGSGALPVETLPSAGLSIQSAKARRSGREVAALSTAFRRLPRPVIGRIEDQALMFDLRCLGDEADFIANLATLKIPEAGDALA
ncbi:L-seryl-tRNA(Sec) selenium transferase [Bradyrhizobium prioriisuperbiae]|uniref:L-seryl-tRNA(Sec) selenium transferase n=1 Tax=Bradyrhizobium prioriisuperbiae TaxID=2854389 RepID=UPI0028ED7B0D|nr:L-seryl-tRNA(Sec) selenium transferase [Bradyrhizobium prioritasuperba]